MGTGKTMVGKEFARRTGRRFVDLDVLIEEREKMPITEIFSNKGESYFRRVETEVLKEVSQQADVVVACGGGIVIDPKNIEIMRQAGKIICLTARPDVILKRTSPETHRPLLNVPEPQKKIEELLEARKSFYALADASIDTSELSIDKVVDRIGTIVGDI